MNLLPAWQLHTEQSVEKHGVSHFFSFSRVMEEKVHRFKTQHDDPNILFKCDHLGSILILKYRYFTNSALIWCLNAGCCACNHWSGLDWTQGDVSVLTLRGGTRCDRLSLR